LLAYQGGQPQSQTRTIRRRLVLRDRRFYLKNDGSRGDYEPSVDIHPDAIDIGCTTISREAVEAAYDLFEKHYPTKQPTAVKVQ
jgi:hypothetical protein